MCFIIAMIFFVASYSFYEKDLQIQAIFSAVLGLAILIFFVYKIIKNRKCFFGNDKDCNKQK
jgi:hypothetical protein